jgi:hypothetical protein
MSEFVGRTGSNRVYSYPEPRRTGNANLSFARNFASGPKTPQLATDGVQIRWNSIDVGASPSTDVLITPLSTGVVLVSGAVTLTNSGATTSAIIRVQVNGVDFTVPDLSGITVASGTTVVVPILTELSPTETPVGVQTPIQISVLGDSIFVASEGSTLNLQEVSVATG